MANFVIGNRTYKSGKLNVFEQSRVFRRMGGLFPNVMGWLSYKDAEPLTALNYVVTALSSLSDEDMDFVIKVCLKACQVQQGPLWVPVASDGGLQFDDITLMQLYQICWAVLEENFAPFIAALQSVSQNAKTANSKAQG